MARNNCQKSYKKNYFIISEMLSIGEVKVETVKFL